MREWLLGLESRERLFLIWGGVFAVGLIFYLGVLEPLHNGIAQKQEQVTNQQQQLAKLEGLIREYNKIGPGNDRPAGGDKNTSLLSVIDQTGSQFGLKSAMKRLTPDGTNKVRIHLENAGFDKLVEWLATLAKEHRLNIETLNLRPSDSQGAVNGNLTLHRW